MLRDLFGFLALWLGLTFTFLVGVYYPHEDGFAVPAYPPGCPGDGVLLPFSWNNEVLAPMGARAFHTEFCSTFLHT